MRPIYESRKEDLHYHYVRNLTAVKHLHPHIELVLLLEGEAEAYAGNNGGMLRAGNAFLAFPNQAHHYNDEHGPIDGRIFIFSAEIFPAFYAYFCDKLPCDPIVPFDMDELLPVLHTMDAEYGNHDRYSRSVIEGGVSIILAHLFRRMEWTAVDRRNISAMQAILDYCNLNYTSDITLDDVAENVHRSKYYVSHVFSREIGSSFPAYINTLRVHDAKKLLTRGDMSVTDVAYAVGFRSLRSFNRCFLSLTGQNPSAFKREGEKNP